MEEVYEIPFSDDDIYYSDDSYSDEVKSNLYNVLEKYMDISNISNDCDLSYDLTEVEVNENESNNCEICKDVYCRMKACDEHIVKLHYGDLFSCEYCSEVLSVSVNINQHQVNVNSCLIHKKI